VSHSGAAPGELPLPASWKKLPGSKAAVQEGRGDAVGEEWRGRWVGWGSRVPHLVAGGAEVVDAPVLEEEGSPSLRRAAAPGSTWSLQGREGERGRGRTEGKVSMRTLPEFGPLARGCIGPRVMPKPEEAVALAGEGGGWGSGEGVTRQARVRCRDRLSPGLGTRPPRKTVIGWAHSSWSPFQPAPQSNPTRHHFSFTHNLEKSAARAEERCKGVP